MKRTLVLVLFLTALLGISSVWAAIINVPLDYLSIQAAIIAASPGDQINVAAGEYVETSQLDINKNLTILGAAAATTIIKPGFNTTVGGNVKSEAFIYVDPLAAVTIKNFTIDCSGQNVNHAIQSRGTLDIEDCAIRNVTHSSVYNGRGIVFYGGNTGNLAKNLTFSNIQRIGIHVRGNVMTPNPVVAIQNVVYTGKGAGDWLDYAVEFGGGGSGTVDNLTASQCLGIASTDGSTSAGILATDYWGTGTTATITNSTLYNNTDGIHVGYGSTDATVLSASQNSIYNNTCGLYSVTTSTIVADYNWWGDTDPSNDVSGNVDYDPWYADAAMTILNSNSYTAGCTYSFTVHAPNSEDGAKASIWGYYHNTPSGWASATYGSGTFSGGYATVTYTVPADYVGYFYWEVKAKQSSSSQSNTALYNEAGPWGQFDTYMLNGQTIELETYRFDNFDMDLDSASYMMVGANGAIPEALDYATVRVLVPWSGSISDYDNSVYNNALYNKVGLYPSYAIERGYAVTVVASNPNSPTFQEIRITKPSIGYDITLFGHYIATNDDPLGYKWDTTFYIAPVASMNMVYDPITGICSGNFSAPLSYDTQYFIQPTAGIMLPDTALWYWYTGGGSMDLILSGGVITPIRNINTGIYYDTIQAAIDDPLTLAGHVITVASGSYAGAVVNKDVNIIGAPDGSSIIATGVAYHPTNPSLTTAFRLDAGANGAEIRNFTINCDDATGYYFAIFSRVVNDVIVNNLTINGSVQGISNWGGSDWEITNNHINWTIASGGGGTGILVGATPSRPICNNNLIQGNVIIADPTAIDFTTPGINVALDVRGTYNNLTGNESVSGNQVLDNVITLNNGLNSTGIEVGVNFGWLPDETHDPAMIAATQGIITDTEISLNAVTGADYGLLMYTVSNTSATYNDLMNCDNAIWIEDGNVNNTFTTNTFTDNYIHVNNQSLVAMDMEALATETDNTYDNYIIIDQIIYGNAAIIYADAPKELIDAGEMQTYSVKASHIEDLRGFSVQVIIPKLDFTTDTEPSNFQLGPLFDGGALLVPAHTSEDWVFTVDGSYWGGEVGITGDDVVLFTFEATSTGGTYANTPTGCYIEVPLGEVTLYNDENGYTEIPCAGTLNKWILIDGVLPDVDIVNILDYPEGMTLEVNGDGVIWPLLDLTYTDNYDLSTALYMIYPAGGTVPGAIADFTVTNVVGTVNGTTTTLADWQLPATSPDGTYVLYLLVTDEAGNFYILPWTFTIDTVAPTALAWALCRTTPNADMSVDLAWTIDPTNPPETIQIWALDYNALTGAEAYPVYNPASFVVPAIENDIDEYDTTVPPVATTFGWIKVAEVPASSVITVSTLGVPATLNGATINTGLARGYYYFTIYGVAENGQISDPPADPFYRESISYWPGDVVAALGVVDANDISPLSLAWGSVLNGDRWNANVNVGPAVNNERRSRRTPDTVINIEDLMMFAMNYLNTDYDYYNRTFPEVNPITIAMNVVSRPDQLTVTLELGENSGFVKGLNIPISYGNGLQLVSVESGEVWPEGSLMLHTNANGVVEISGATLGEEPIVEGNGNIVTLTFAVTGPNTALAFEHMTARTHDNQEIEIVNNPGSYTDTDDLVNVIPETSYLGHNYPNPFNPSTTLQYGLKDAGSVRLSVFNSRGQLIRTLVNETKAPGTYQINWNGRDNNGRLASSGIYFFRMETSEGVKTAKGLMIK